jgi:hypothetical protein
VESGPALLHSAGREDYLHCGGGRLFSDWAPLLGNTIADGAGATEGYTAQYDGRPDDTVQVQNYMSGSLIVSISRNGCPSCITA